MVLQYHLYHTLDSGTTIPPVYSEGDCLVVNGLQLGPMQYPDMQYVSEPSDKSQMVVSAKVTGLKPLQMYRFFVWAFTNAGQGSEYFIDDSTVAADCEYAACKQLSSIWIMLLSGWRSSLNTRLLIRGLWVRIPAVALLTKAFQQASNHTGVKLDV